MELYLKEQIKKAYELIRRGDRYFDKDEILEQLTPIELPSDEEIDEASPYIPNDSKIDYLSHQEGFIKGAKWMKEQILNQNK